MAWSNFNKKWRRKHKSNVRKGLLQGSFMDSSNSAFGDAVAIGTLKHYKPPKH